jgi:hypothetical protein
VTLTIVVHLQVFSANNCGLKFQLPNILHSVWNWQVAALNWFDGIHHRALCQYPQIAGQPPSPWLWKWHTFGRCLKWRQWSPKFLLLKILWSIWCIISFNANNRWFLSVYNTGTWGNLVSVLIRTQGIMK